MRQSAPSEREAPKTKVRDAALDVLFEKADVAMAELAAALHDLRVSVSEREHS